MLENEFHRVWGMQGLGNLDLNPWAVDWLKKALHGEIPDGHDKTVYIRQKSGRGALSGPVPEEHPRRW